MKRISILFVLLIFAAPLFAHHGTEISYDRSKAMTLKGTVTDFRYANPHPIVFFDVTDKDGKIVHWTGEVAPTPFTLQQNGWARTARWKPSRRAPLSTLQLVPRGLERPPVLS